MEIARPGLVIRCIALLLATKLTGQCQSYASPQTAVETGSAAAYFPQAQPDGAFREIRGTVLESYAGRQVTIDVGFEDGIENGHQLSVQRGEAALGPIEVVEVFPRKSRCIAEQVLEIGDRVQLGTPLQIRGLCRETSGAPLAGAAIGVFRVSNNYVDVPSLVSSTLTNADGNYQLPNVRATLRSSRVP